MMKIMVVGPGRVGTALAVAMQQAGHDIVGALSRRTTGLQADLFKQLTSAPVYQFPSTDVKPTTDLQLIAPPRMGVPDVFLLTVPDKAVTQTAQTLAGAGYFDNVEVIIAHCAGSMSAKALSPANQPGVRRLCWHPLQSIADPRMSPACFEGVTFTLDGDKEAVAAAKKWVTGLKGLPVEIAGEDRTRYHAAAVLAANAMTALAATAASVSGLEHGMTALLPLMRGAVGNIERFGLPDALTGPVERGDVETVEAHLKSLQDNPTAFDVYRVLGKATLDIARQKGSLTEQQLSAFLTLFSPGK
ncbi:Rossmann-like and DUF2520 domain-containing protein [Alicyclobacillus sp. SO9]|uniref:Rossmann-like and DUF2520 domain-containing protein n=1 Tax=Alicyclobacillus sp. SO9 TaxID=2665646 RepID=UPI0018E81929|nr:Rossmann-like and DUF2520 domain-containing protein [Alicyclobacillus sp. SO9]QQE78630.1 DUF2520 domain-containing protein [Alicyclobacillus sp. SO9]